MLQGVMTMQDYKEAIRAKRGQLQLSQRQLAKMIDVSQPFINEIESGRKKPSLDVLYQICEALQLEIVFQDAE